MVPHRGEAFGSRRITTRTAPLRRLSDLPRQLKHSRRLLEPRRYATLGTRDCLS